MLQSEILQFKINAKKEMMKKFSKEELAESIIGTFTNNDFIFTINDNISASLVIDIIEDDLISNKIKNIETDRVEIMNNYMRYGMKSKIDKLGAEHQLLTKFLDDVEDIDFNILYDMIIKIENKMIKLNKKD